MSGIHSLGDCVHHLAAMYLVAKIVTSRSCAGVSAQTQLLNTATYSSGFAIEFFRYYYSNRCDFTGMHLMVLMLLAYATPVLIFCFRSTYESQHDNFRWWLMVIPVGGIALFQESDTLQTVITFNTYLHAVCLLPQFYMIANRGKATKTVLYYFLLMWLSRTIYVLDWVHRFYLTGYFDLKSVSAGVVQSLIYLKFFYHYGDKVLKRPVTNQMRDHELGEPVQEEPLSSQPDREKILVNPDNQENYLHNQENQKSEPNLENKGDLPPCQNDKEEVWLNNENQENLMNQEHFPDETKDSTPTNQVKEESQLRQEDTQTNQESQKNIEEEKLQENPSNQNKENIPNQENQESQSKLVDQENVLNQANQDCPMDNEEDQEIISPNHDDRQNLWTDKRRMMVLECFPGCFDHHLAPLSEKPTLLILQRQEGDFKLMEVKTSKV